MHVCPVPAGSCDVYVLRLQRSTRGAESHCLMRSLCSSVDSALYLEGTSCLCSTEFEYTCSPPPGCVFQVVPMTLSKQEESAFAVTSEEVTYDRCALHVPGACAGQPSVPGRWSHLGITVPLVSPLIFLVNAWNVAAATICGRPGHLEHTAVAKKRPLVNMNTNIF